MEKDKKIKIFLGLVYLLIVTLFVGLIFSQFTLSELTSYEFIKNNRNHLITAKDSNLFLSSVFFLFFTILWVLLLGFGSPIFLMGGFIFGKWLGTILVVLGLSTGATFLYILANYFFKDLIKEKFLLKFQNLVLKFKKNELIYFTLYRFIGGIPFAIANLLPVIFNIKIKNYFVGTLIGLAPQLFLLVSLGSGLEKIIQQNETMPSITDLVFSSDIYIPIIGFIFIVLITLFIRKFFYRK